MFDRIALPVMLSALAGYVDAIGFLRLGGLFVSFMSGNSTQLGVGLAGGGHHDWPLAAGLILGFVLGVILGAVVATRTGRWSQAAVLALESALLLSAAALAMQGHTTASLVAIVLAMGVENNVFKLGVTYMTGTLVRVGQAIAAALGGGRRFAWVADLCLWAGLVVGAIGGAAAYGRLGLLALWLAAGFAAFLTLAVGLRAAIGRVAA
ncbi:MAG TPA: DUF1275 family protein [Stellaceae bacterium]|jgi:uncharacterized membrane protein YoaK (UPF0700 family)|nr:DUF1275 family protein [Stellaceae bacterium]